MKKTIREESPGTSIGNMSVTMPDTMKKKKFVTPVIDRRFDPTKQPKMLKSFSDFLKGK